MTARATVIATVESNHTVKVPTDLPIGEQVAVVPMPPIESLLNDAARRARFAATRAALQQAIADGFPPTSLSDKEIVALVKQARKATSPTDIS